MKKLIPLVSIVLALPLLQGCVESVSPHQYSTAAAGVAAKVEHGVIVSKRSVKIQGKSGVGAMAGAVAGAAGGSAIGGSGHANLAAGVGGAVLAGVIGDAMDKAINTHKAIEYIIKLKGGNVISLAQTEDLSLEVNQKVLVIYGPQTRVIPDTL